MPVRRGSFAPLRIRLFALLMTVQLVNATAVWAHVVTVQWTLTARGASATVVSLAPAAIALPFLLLSLPVGAVVGFASRGRLLFTSAVASALTSLLSALLGRTEDVHWAWLVTTVLVVGTALVITGVTWQAMIPTLVRRELLGSASVIDGSVYNVARAVGPLLAGLGLGLVGVSGIFLAVAVVFVACAAVLATVEMRHPNPRGVRRPIVPEMLAGLQFARYSPWTRGLLTRMACFGLPASALWALASLVVHDRIGLGSGGFGVMMALIGSGGVIATFVLPRLRDVLSVSVFAAVFSGLYGVTLLVLGLVTSSLVVGIVMMLGGVAWVAVQSTWMMLAQQALPEWVRPRVIALLLFLFQGTQAVGALLWGVAADLLGLPGALVAAAAGTALSIVVLLWRGLGSSRGIEPDLAAPDHGVIALVDEALARHGDGALQVRYHYRVAAPQTEALVAAMEALRLARLRLGAIRWRLDPPAPGQDIWTESYQVPDPHTLRSQETERLTVPENRLRFAVRELASRVEGPLLAPIRTPSATPGAAGQVPHGPDPASTLEGERA